MTRIRLIILFSIYQQPLGNIIRQLPLLCRWRSCLNQKPSQPHRTCLHGIRTRMNKDVFPVSIPKKVAFPLKHKYVLTLQSKSSVVRLHKMKSIQRWSFPRNSNLANRLPQPKSPVFVQETIRARWCHLTTNNLLSWQRRRLLIARNRAPPSLYLQAQVHNWP